MDKENIFLIYVISIGSNWKGENLYEFVFSDSLEGVDGDNWDEYPATGKPEPPHAQYIKYVGKITTKFKFDVIQDSDTFSVWDAVDGVIAMAIENITEYDEYPASRLFFFYGKTLKFVEDELYAQDIILEVEKVNEHEETSS